MKKMTSLLLAAALMAGLFLSGCGGGASQPPAAEDEPVTLSFAYFLGAGSLYEQKIAEPFEKLVYERSEGSITIERYPGATLAAADATLDAVKTGLADIGMLYTGFEPGSLPITFMMEYPNFYASAKAASYTMRDLLTELKPAELDGLHLLMNYCSGEGIMLSNVKPISSPADVAGQEIRVSGIMGEVITAFGGTPVSMVTSEAYEALRSGVVDGYMATPESVNNLKLYEVTKYATRIHFCNTSYLTLMNAEKYASLSENQRKILDECAAEIFETVASDWMEVAASITYEALEGVGNEIVYMTDEQEQAFIDLISHLPEKYAETLDGQGIDGSGAFKLLKELLDKYNAMYPDSGNTYAPK